MELLKECIGDIYSGCSGSQTQDWGVRKGGKGEEERRNGGIECEAFAPPRETAISMLVLSLTSGIRRERHLESSSQPP